MAPGPLIYGGAGSSLCISYIVGSWKMIIGDNCDTLFYFDGKFIREASSHRCLSPVSYVNYAEVYFTIACTQVVIFQDDEEESDLSFPNAPTYSIHSYHGYIDPGTRMVVYIMMRKYAIRKGKRLDKVDMFPMVWLCVTAWCFSYSLGAKRRQVFI